MGQRVLLRDKHLPEMWGLESLSGATVLPSHLLQTHLFQLFVLLQQISSATTNANCMRLPISKIQHEIEFVEEEGSSWGRVVHPGRWWLIIGDYPKYPRSTASLGTRIPWILVPVASLSLSLFLSQVVKPTRSICSSLINHLTRIPFHLLLTRM